MRAWQIRLVIVLPGNASGFSCYWLAGIGGGGIHCVMRYQPGRNYVSNDDIQTPPELAARIVAYFRPEGRILEPCAGTGHFLACLAGADWCEIKRDRDFFDYRERVDWIITNPPWSQIRAFMTHAFSLADQVVFLMTVNHAWTRAGSGLHASGDLGCVRFCWSIHLRAFRKAASNWARSTTSEAGPAPLRWPIAKGDPTARWSLYPERPLLKPEIEIACDHFPSGNHRNIR